MNKLVETVLREINSENNPYFVDLKNKTFSQEDFIETQIQFFFAVTFFSRPMAALAAKIPSPKLRLEIMRNVWEEHGEGDPQRIHGVTFQTLLKRLASVTPEKIEARSLWPEVRQFNTLLAGVCVIDEYLIGCATMGMVERMFCDISYWTAQGIINNGWLSSDQMIHYDLHKDLDVRHSQDFFDVLSASWNENPETQYYIEQGLRLGATAFYSLYEGLHRARKRRWIRNVTGPHSRA